jgi:hypothetical protein
MPKPIDDTDMLATMAEDIVAGRAETPTGAMRLHGVERGSGQERRLLKKWAVHGDVLLVAMRRAEVMRDDALAVGFNLGRQAESDAREAAMIAGTSALALPEGIAQSVAEQMSAPPSWWERITSRRAKVVE